MTDAGGTPAAGDGTISVKDSRPWAKPVLTIRRPRAPEHVPVLDSEPYDLTTVAAAYQAVAAGTARDKVIVRVSPGEDGAAAR